MLAITAVLACVLAFDEVSFVQTNGLSAGASYFVTQYESAPTGTVVAGPKRSYTKFFSAGGTKPVRFVVAADIDGDTVDEYVVVREKKANGAAIVTAYSQPTKLGSKQPKPLASFAAAGVPKLVGDGAITDLGSIAFDVEPGDELVLLRDYVDGHQEVEIVDSPRVKKQPFGGALARVAVAVPGGERVRAAFGVETQAGVDALILVHQEVEGALRLAAYPKPSAGASALGAPLASVPISIGVGETWFDAAKGARSQAGSASILLATRTAEGQTRVDRVGVDGPFGELEATQSFAFVNSAIHHVFGLRRPDDSAPPSIAVKIPISCHYLIGAFGGDSLTIGSIHGGFGSAKLLANGDYWIGFPDASSILLKPTAVPSKYTPQPAIFGWQYEHPETGQTVTVQYDLTGISLTSSGTPEKPHFSFLEFSGDSPIGLLTGFESPKQLIGVGLGDP